MQAAMPLQGLAAVIDAALPQTQCTRCGYADCAAYAQALADNEADINQCPPGGFEGVARLAEITGRPVIALNPEHGLEGPLQIAVVDESWCIGCTLCIKACPTDAILGANKLMHTVISAHCTGCELCIPVCPVDCIELHNSSGSATGWQAWSPAQALHARQRYAVHKKRQAQEPLAFRIAAEAGAHPSDSAVQSRGPEQELRVTDKQAKIAAILAKARNQRDPDGKQA
ncbi:RnfABCDGE type electron transport complex subunit B [Comamonas composti]|uniref:RnfABCDGE type electron transport complex subunit B n=1 Tax=Comamonas composti TaxID=408558 RepID=UPI0004140BB5|nr:RnfABCDGE type electron transport complex subunit B [Comamonas composti]